MRCLAALICFSTLAFAAEPVVHVVASLERGGCIEMCPAYKVTVWSDGRVEWVGHHFVKVEGKAVAKLSADELAALRLAFTEAGYLALSAKLNCYEATDNPTVKTSFSDGVNSRAIEHYLGCRSPPDAAKLTRLEDRFDAIIGTTRWIGTGERGKQQK